MFSVLFFTQKKILLSRNLFCILPLLLSLLLSPPLALGAGYEKTVIFSGKKAGVAGAGIATTGGAESLFYNPAGIFFSSLESAQQNFDASIHFSPSFLNSSGPVDDSSSRDSVTAFLPIGGAMISYRFAPRFAAAMGVFPSGGSRATFENLEFFINPGDTSVGTYTFRPTLSSQITVLEYSLGLAAEVFPRFTLGASWRVVSVSGALKTAVRGAGTLTEIDLNDLSQTKFNAFRVGAQYKGDRWGAGLVFRSGVQFTLEGKLQARIQTAKSLEAISDLPVDNNGVGTATNEFPFQVGVGGYFDVMDKKVRFIGEYSFTNYSTNQQISLTGSLNSGAPNLANTPVLQVWNDQHVGRIGVEYRGLQDITLRTGYALTSQVTPTASARATFTAPGMAHTVTAGGGYTFWNKKMDVDLALEWARSSGSVEPGDTPSGSSTNKGDYVTQAIGIHTGLTYRF